MTETFPWMMQNIPECLPLWKGLGFFLATFVLEDATTLAAGLTIAAGMVSWPVALLSCWLGIWLGDAGLYALARFGGRKWYEKSSLRKFGQQINVAKEWFARNTTLVLILSRCVPGTRLPTYLAAGFLGVSFGKFFLVTGLAALIWTLCILLLAQTIGAPLVHWLNGYSHGSLVLVITGVVLLAALQLIRRRLKRPDMGRILSKLEAWRHWEFWPAWLFYIPVAFHYLWLSIRYRGFTVPSAANPGIFSGGLVGESKFDILKTLSETSPEFTADAALITGVDFMSRSKALEKACEELRMGFPFILKPNLGQRGAGFKLVRERSAADNYLRQTSTPVLVQCYAPGPFEVGVFYYRFPHKAQGKIFAITEKIFPVLVGNGKSTLRQLIQADARAHMIAEKYERRFAARLDMVPEAGVGIKLVEAGNHAQGCIFRDGQRLITPALEERIDQISQRLNGFYIGRYDIRFQNEEDFCAGRNFQIIELNGAASEATNIYDARNSLWSAYQTLFEQWKLVFAIGADNRRKGFKPMGLFALLRVWHRYARSSAQYPVSD
jgi:membrane protein DedA with SNARE-associated domain